MKLNEKDYENIINMIVNTGDVIDELAEYRKDGETLCFQSTCMVDGYHAGGTHAYICTDVDFEIDDDSIECYNDDGDDVEHDFDSSKVVIETSDFSD